MADEITVPSFDYSAFYYPDIYQALLLYKRGNTPELTDESDHEPLIQMLKSFACVGHLNSVLIDLYANESTLVTAKLAETVRNMLRLIDYDLSPATPSQVEILCKLGSVLVTSTEVVPIRAQVSTKRTNGDVPVIYFEALSGVTTPRTDQFGAVFSETADGTFVDHTSDCNAGSTWTPWAAGVAAGAHLYFGHAEVLWNKLDLAISGASDITNGVWEFYDGNAEDTPPDSVTNLGSGVLQFDVSTLLGDDDRTGALVRVTVLSTGAYEEVSSTWDGAKNVVNTGLIEQASPSTTAADYVVGVEWQEMVDVADDSAQLQQSGEVNYTLPQDSERNWQKTTVNGFEGYFIRYRVIDVTSSGGSLGLCRMSKDGTSQYVMTTVTQGRSVVGEVIGSSSGEESQSFETVNKYFIWDSEIVYVDSVEWTRVDNFLSSKSQDEHYRIVLGTDDKASVVFGNGTNGKIPPVGQGNLVIDYRHSANDDGNVGSSTVVVDKTGLSYVSSVTNPRAAIGWAEAESASQESLERAKVAGPASLRTREVAIGPEEIETLVENYTDSNGSKLFVRAVAIEEAFGPKTVGVVVVPRGGGTATSAQLSELETYLNGDKEADPPVAKKIVANVRAVCINYTPKSVDVDADVEAPSTVTSAQVVNQLSALLRPEAVKTDGVTWVWLFSGKIPRERIVHEIFSTDPSVRNVRLNTPSGSDPQLGSRELPVAGTLTIRIVSSI